MFYMTLMMSQLMKTKTTKLRKKRSTQLLRECWSFWTKLMTCQNLQNKLLNITVLFIWHLLASLKKMSLTKHGVLYLILASTCFSPLAILASVWKKNGFPHCQCTLFITYLYQATRSNYQGLFYNRFSTIRTLLIKCPENNIHIFNGL